MCSTCVQYVVGDRVGSWRRNGNGQEAGPPGRRGDPAGGCVGGVGNGKCQFTIRGIFADGIRSQVVCTRPTLYYRYGIAGSSKERGGARGVGMGATESGRVEECGGEVAGCIHAPSLMVSVDEG